MEWKEYRASKKSLPHPHHFSNGPSLKVMVMMIGNTNLLMLPSAGEPPEIVDFLKGDLDKISDDFTIPCKATGTKPLTWTWKKDGVVFPWYRNSEVFADGTLSVEYISQFDDGVYQCFVKNAFGETYSRKVKVKVTGTWIKQRNH